MQETYKPQLIGSWYQENYIEQVEGFLKKAKPNMNENPKMVLVPHAGLRYSGQTSANVYNQINWNNFDKIIILCTLHRSRNKIFIPSFDKVVFPNNEIDILNIDLKGNYYEKSKEEFEREHSFEIQLPFIFKLAQPNTKIFPMLIGDSNYDNIVKDLLNSSIFDNKTLIIATSDFTHYGPNYNHIVDVTKLKNINTIKEYIINKDAIDINAILKNSFEKFIGYTVCGTNVIELMMKLGEKLNLKPKLISYARSSKVEPIINSVSYVGIIYS